jgi:hypothetical protein
MTKAMGHRVAAIALVAAVLLVGVVILPRVGIVFGGAAGIHDAQTLAEHIDVCGRSWRKVAINRQLSMAAIRERDGIEPVVVDPGPLAGCPVGPCTTVAQNGPCNTVIYVRVGEDAYLAYELQGGP